MLVALPRLNLNNQTKNAILDSLPRWHTFTPPPNDNQGGAISSTLMSLKVISFNQVL